MISSTGRLLETGFLNESWSDDRDSTSIMRQPGLSPRKPWSSLGDDSGPMSLNDNLLRNDIANSTADFGRFLRISFADPPLPRYNAEVWSRNHRGGLIAPGQDYPPIRGLL